MSRSQPTALPAGGRGGEAGPQRQAPGSGAAGRTQMIPSYMRAVVVWTAVFLAVPAAGWLVLAVAGRSAAPVPVISEHSAPAPQQATPAHYSAAQSSVPPAPSKTPQPATPAR